ncbi:pyrroline-5-carboxylate reductase family protein [Akkermansia muciniphila]|uniref:pyrroline-5-carboxylate reductase family protein n=1 Tax=Akkermansia muciniphila TaxID=239935 RepID=UPI001C05F8FB|nr:NAD(P)-binding domain-containing protein [Akkermansia muciniphila]QWP41219.1 NAD(P)-binding domain-containing protein [Akkermansia muciniphila]
MKTGIIGLGKMGGALLRGMLKAGAAVPEEVWVYDHHHENMQALREEYPGVHEAASEAEAADAVEVLILAVKPHGILPLISSLSERGAELPLLISIAAAVSLDDMEACASDGTRIIRAMPNTPCMVLAGVIAYSTGNGVKDEDEEAARMLLSGCGSVYKVAESGMNAVSAISGCGPAYMFTALDALADAGVAMGLSRKNRFGTGCGNHAGGFPDAGTDREASHGAPG